MKRKIRVAFGEALAAELAMVSRRLGVSRTAFAKKALRCAVREAKISEMERRHREGYMRHPVESGEFSDFEQEQVWPPWVPGGSRRRLRRANR